jgi:hypothetical protein
MPPFSKPSVRRALCLFLSLCLLSACLCQRSTDTEERCDGQPPSRNTTSCLPASSRSTPSTTRANSGSRRTPNYSRVTEASRWTTSVPRSASRANGSMRESSSGLFLPLSLSRVAWVARQLTLRERYIGQGPRALHRRRPIDVLDRPRQRHRRDAPPRRQECALRRRHQAG